jgi:DNA-binding protein
MSCVCILTPVVIAAWPAFSAAVAAAATSLGYTIVEEGISQRQESKVSAAGRGVQLEIEQSEIVTNQLGRDQRIKVMRGGVTVTFERDARGKASICVTGPGHTDDELRAIGEELSQRVVQKYVHRRLLDEMQARGFNVVEEEVDANQAIRLKVRHWDN